MKTFLIALIFAFSLSPASHAQTAPIPSSAYEVKTFYLANINSVSEADSVSNAVRNVMPNLNVAYVFNQNALLVRGTHEQLAQVQQLLASLDRPKRAYRLTYTISDFDGEHLVGKQHFSLIVVSGGRTTLKSGSKIPIATDDKGGGQTQFTYYDLGLNFDASLDDYVDGMRLRTKVERSSIPDEKAAGGLTEPIIRQSVLEGTSLLTPGKPLLLGSMDTPSSTRRLDIEVVMDPIK